MSSRPEEWPTLESRVVALHRAAARHPRRRPGARATFFVLGWVAERHRGLVREIDARGHEVACHGYGHRMIQRLQPRRVRARTSRGPRARSRTRPARAVLGYRAPTFSVMRETLWSLDVLARGRLPLRLEHLPDRPRPLRHPRRAALPPSAHGPASGAEIAEFPLSTVADPGAAVPRGGRRLLPPRPLCRHPRARSGGSTSARASRPWCTCIRGRSTRRSRACRWARWRASATR